MAAANFEIALSLLGPLEGGWSDRDPKDDPGGATMKGVTLRTYRAYRKMKGQPVPTKQDLRAITNAEVREVYRTMYWDVVRADQLPPGLDLAVFDFAVNSGPGTAAEHLQRLVGTTPDGIVGAQTLAAARETAEAGAQPLRELIHDYMDARWAYMKTLKNFKANPGWKPRIKAVRQAALELVASSAPVATVPMIPAEEAGKASPAQTKVNATPEGRAATAAAVNAALAGLAELSKTVQPLAEASQVAMYLFLFLALSSAGITAWIAVRRIRRTV
jgi:lysozyme family protein